MGAPDNGIQIGKKLEPVERFGQVTIGTCAKRRDLVVGAGVSRHDKNGNRHVILANQPGKACTVTIGEIDVEKHRINSVVLQFRKRRFNVVRRGLKMSCLLESHTEDVCDDRIIFYDQYMHGFISQQLRFNSAAPIPRAFLRLPFLNVKSAVQGGESVINQTVIYSAKTLNSRMRD